MQCPQVPALNIFESSLRRGKFDESRKLSNGSLMEFAHVYPMDAVFDTQDEVPEEVRRLRPTVEDQACSPRSMYCTCVMQCGDEQHCQILAHELH